MAQTFPCYVHVLDSFKAERKDQMSLKKGEYVRVLRADETDDHYFGEVLGKSGYFPNYYAEVVTEDQIPRKDKEQFRKLDKQKEKELEKEKEKEQQQQQLQLQQQQQQRELQLQKDKEKEKELKEQSTKGVALRIAKSGTERGDRASGTSSPQVGSPPMQKSPVLKKVATMPRGSSRVKTDINVEDISIEVKSVSLPPVSPQARKMSQQEKRLSRVNPRDVKRLHEGPTFGVPLAHQMYIGYDEFVIPPILHRSVVFLHNHLDTEGLFRISGAQEEISEWKTKFNAGEPVVFDERTSPHNVAGLLKAWLRELPEPLLTYNLFDDWMRSATRVTIGTSPPEKLLKSINRKLDALPSINFAVLRELFLFLRDLVAHSARNRMTAENLGVVIGPNILGKENQDALTSVTVMPAAVALAAYFVQNATALFERQREDVDVERSSAKDPRKSSNSGLDKEPRKSSNGGLDKSGGVN